jgi:hypothetical protein
LQLDVGANIGLNRQTPAAQVYAGVSQRFERRASLGAGEPAITPGSACVLTCK